MLSHNDMWFLLYSITPSLEPVVVLCGEDLATSAVSVGMNGKQTYEDRPLLAARARGIVPVALVRRLKMTNNLYTCS